MSAPSASTTPDRLTVVDVMSASSTFRRCELEGVDGRGGRAPRDRAFALGLRVSMIVESHPGAPQHHPPKVNPASCLAQLLFS